MFTSAKVRLTSICSQSFLQMDSTLFPPDLGSQTLYMWKQATLVEITLHCCEIVGALLMNIIAARRFRSEKVEWKNESRSCKTIPIPMRTYIVHVLTALARHHDTPTAEKLATRFAAVRYAIANTVLKRMGIICAHISGRFRLPSCRQAIYLSTQTARTQARPHCPGPAWGPPPPRPASVPYPSAAIGNWKAARRIGIRKLLTS